MLVCATSITLKLRGKLLNLSTIFAKSLKPIQNGLENFPKNFFLKLTPMQTLTNFQ